MTKNEIVLVNPYPYYAYGTNESTLEPPIGILYLAGVLIKNGFSPAVIDANVLGLSAESTLEKILRYEPRVVGFSVNIVTYRAARELSELMRKQRPGIKIVMGGPYPTIFAEKVLEQTSADYAVIGEGENTFHELCSFLLGQGGPAPENIRGLAYKNASGIFIQTRPRERISDLDSLPFPDYSFLPELVNYRTRARGTPAAPLLTSRGCLHQCIYCSKDVFQSRITYRSPENVFSEIKALVERFGVKQIDIMDDNFTMDMERAEKLMDLIIADGIKVYINLQSGIRADRINERVVKKMKQAGVYKISFGVESGDKKMLEVIKKKINLEQVLNASRWARSCGIVTYGFFMIGLPGETEETFRRTLEFAKKMNPTFANFVITIPFPGTELYAMIKEKGTFLIDLDDGLNFGFYAGKVYYSMGGMAGPEAVLGFYKTAFKEFYLRPSKALEVLGSVRSPDEIKWIIRTVLSILRSLALPTARPHEAQDIHS